MRVAIDVTSLIGHRTGVGESVAEILRAFDHLAVDTQPYTLSFRARDHKKELPGNNAFIPIPARTLLTTWPRFGRPSIDHWVRHCDIVHGMNYLAPPTKLPLLVTVHDCSFARFPHLVSREVQKYKPILERALRNGAWVHVTTEFMAAEVLSIFSDSLVPNRVAVVNFGFPPLGEVSNAPIEKFTNGKPFILSLSTIEPRKNIDRLVAAFALLAENIPDVHLVIAGAPGAAQAEVELAMRTLPERIFSRITLTGPVSPPQRDALLRAASVLAYPSLYEGFGFPILQAMSVGTPVVTADAGAIPEVVGDAACLVDPLDVNDLAQKLELVLTDSNLRERLQERGKKRSALFSWDTTAMGLEAVYEKMLANQ